MLGRDATLRDWYRYFRRNGRYTAYQALCSARGMMNLYSTSGAR